MRAHQAERARAKHTGPVLLSSLGRDAGATTTRRPILTAMTALRCVDHRHPDQCGGPVQLRESLTGTGTPIARCDTAWADRLDLQARLRRDYPDSPVPPPWFDAAYAGESWEEHD